MSLLCSHQMVYLMNNSKILLLSDINKQWHLDDINQDNILTEENFFVNSPVKKLDY